MILKLKTNVVWELLKDGSADQNWLPNSNGSKCAISEDATLHTLENLSKHKFSF